MAFTSAMAGVERAHHRLTVRTRRDAETIHIEVEDTGPGIAPDSLERIFNPFYTTKEPGQGTGLGLAIVARTVHESGGVVWVDPAREGGAVFKVFLPLAGDSDASADR